MRIMWWFPFLMQMKQLAQMQQQQQQQQQQPPPTLQQQQQDRLAGVTVDVSNSFHSNDPAYGGLEPSPSTNSTGMVKVLMSLLCHSYLVRCLAVWVCVDFLRMGLNFVHVKPYLMDLCFFGGKGCSKGCPKCTEEKADSKLLRPCKQLRNC